jgi:hypothetical protein
VPADAVVLFDGKSLDPWVGGEKWPVADGVATVGKGAIQTKQGFGDCHLHVEFRLPSPATGKGQGRGNSGVFLMGQYEIQVLDSFEDGTDGPLTLAIQISQPGIAITASGDESETAYDFNAPSVTMALTGIEGVETEAVDMTAKITLTNTTGKYIRITCTFQHNIVKL